MKTPEILLASGVIALVAGVGAALAARAFEGTGARAEAPRASSTREVAAATSLPADTQRALDELRMENSDLRGRLAALETRLAEALSARTPARSEPDPYDELEAELLASDDWSTHPQAIDLDPGFVANVGRALAEIRAREEAERETKRKELQAQRIEERVTKLQVELGLTQRQTSDLRTTLLAQDEKRETLLADMREGAGDPRDMRDTFRTIRDDTHTALQGFLTPEQFTAYRESEESDFRRGFGDFGGGPRPPDDGTSRRQGR